MTADQRRALRSLRDCGAVGVREGGYSRGLAELDRRGFAKSFTKRLGGAWWHVYSLTDDGRRLALSLEGVR